ncbi:MAG: pyridoxal phosphate-dependent aminotransferase, partial [Chloroflexota bacterium]
PIVEPPDEFKAELRRLAENPVPGMHRYMANAGYEETRAGVAQQLESETGVTMSSRDICMTVGASGAMNSVLKTLLDPDDEVIVLAPYFVEFLAYIGNHGGKPRVVKTGPDFLPDLAEVEAAIGANTKAIVLNSPNNPSGVVYSEQIIAGLSGLLSRKEKELGSPIYVISDEPYRRIIFDGLKPVSVFNHYRNSIVVSSHSKDLALPGERIGYAALNPAADERDELMAGIIYSNRILGFVNAPALMQHAVRNIQHITVSVPDYERKRDILYGALTDMGYDVVRPQGAFYMFPKAPVDDDVEFVHELLSLLVLVVPGQGFGASGHFRISYCVDDRTLDRSLEGFRKAAVKYGLTH